MTYFICRIMVPVFVAYVAVCQSRADQVASSNSGSKPPSNVAPSGNYRLGAGDAVVVDVPDLPEEFNGKTFRVDGDGHLR